VLVEKVQHLNLTLESFIDKAVKQEFISALMSNMRNNIQLQAEDAEVEDTWEVVKDSF
jgi:hypothetical protein